jgi:hypothetical protein
MDESSLESKVAEPTLRESAKMALDYLPKLLEEEKVHGSLLEIMTSDTEKKIKELKMLFELKAKCTEAQADELAGDVVLKFPAYIDSVFKALKEDRLDLSDCSYIRLSQGLCTSISILCIHDRSSYDYYAISINPDDNVMLNRCKF